MIKAENCKRNQIKDVWIDDLGLLPKNPCLENLKKKNGASQPRPQAMTFHELLAKGQDLWDGLHYQRKSDHLSTDTVEAGLPGRDEVLKSRNNTDPSGRLCCECGSTKQQRECSCAGQRKAELVSGAGCAYSLSHPLCDCHTSAPIKHMHSRLWFWGQRHRKARHRKSSCWQGRDNRVSQCL